MAIKITEKKEGKLLEVLLSEKLSHADYARFVPEFERLYNLHGKLRVLFEMADFHGWGGAALWDDIKFGVKHFFHIEKIAMVGEKQWEKGMSVFCEPFTNAEIRYYDRAEIDLARAWLEEA